MLDIHKTLQAKNVKSTFHYPCFSKYDASVISFVNNFKGFCWVTCLPVIINNRS